jgi:hypothetical protein
MADDELTKQIMGKLTGIDFSRLGPQTQVIPPTSATSVPSQAAPPVAPDQKAMMDAIKFFSRKVRWKHG